MPTSCVPPADADPRRSSESSDLLGSPQEAPSAAEARKILPTWTSRVDDESGYVDLDDESPIKAGDGVAQLVVKSAVRTVGSAIGREIVRGVMGGLLGGSQRKR